MNFEHQPPFELTPAQKLYGKILDLTRASARLFFKTDPETAARLAPDGPDSIKFVCFDQLRTYNASEPLDLPSVGGKFGRLVTLAYTNVSASPELQRATFNSHRGLLAHLVIDPERPIEPKPLTVFTVVAPKEDHPFIVRSMLPKSILPKHEWINTNRQPLSNEECQAIAELCGRQSTKPKTLSYIAIMGDG